MTFKIDNLKDFEAVQAGDTVIVQVPHRWGGYMAGNRQLIGTQITINKDEPLYTYTAPKRTWIKTILKDGTELSAQEANAIHNQYYDDDEEKMVYPSLKEEFAHRERLLEIGEGEKVYLEEEVILTPVEYTIVGELKDTGNPFVETAVSYGKGRFSTSDNSFFKLNVSEVIGDTLKKFAAEAELPFKNGTHSGYKYAKIKDQYVIGSGSKWEKQSENSFKYFPSLRDAQKYENDLRSELHDYLAAKFNMTVIGKFVAAEIFADLQAILNKVEGLAVMQKAQDNKQYTKNAINALMKKLGEVK
jgi:hypothetical protein